MARPQESFNKKDVQKKQEKKKKEKEKKRQEKREKKQKNSLDDMIAYVDENGMITSTPPDPEKKEEIKTEDIDIGASRQEESPATNQKRNGKVTYFNTTKGYGFIKDAESKEDVFVHVKNANKELKEGDIVSYDMEKGPKGPYAENVVVS
jgi:cold shock CspA family protein